MFQRGKPPPLPLGAAASGSSNEANKPTPRAPLSRGLKLYLLCAILAVAAVSTLALYTVAPSYVSGLYRGKAVVGGKKGGGKQPGGGKGGKGAAKPTLAAAAVSATPSRSAPAAAAANKAAPAGAKKRAAASSSRAAAAAAVAASPSRAAAAAGAKKGGGGAPRALPAVAAAGDKRGKGAGKGEPPLPPQLHAPGAVPAAAAAADEQEKQQPVAAEGAAVVGGEGGGGDSELEDKPPVFSDAELNGLGNETEGDAGVAGGAGAAAGDEEDAPREFTHDHDPIPALGHDEVHRPFAGRGCSFKLCNKQPGAYTVGGAPASALPLMYMVVPHRNRVDNIVRLLSSLNNATTPAQRACLCILLTDFNTTTAVISPWKNVHCLVSFRAKHGIYMDDESFTPPRELKKGDLKKAAAAAAAAKAAHGGGAGVVSGPQACPRVALNRSALGSPEFGAWGSVTAHFPPAHLDVAGLTGRQAVRHALAFYDGESAILDGNKYVKDARIKFSRAGGIMAGIDAIQTPPERSLVFICDADMILRPGFMEDMLRVPVPAKTVFLPIIWSMCWGAAIEDGPKRSNWRSSRKGFWRPGGRGMVVAYLSDIKSVGGMRDMVRRRVWGQEDDRFYAKLSRKFNVTRTAAPYLLHYYHSRVKDWSRSDDGISMGPAIGPLGKHVCIPSGSCTCPPGTSPKLVAAAIKEELNITVKIL